MSENTPTLVRVPLADLRDAPTNPNSMSATQVAALTASIRELGFLAPIVGRRLADGTIEIVDGHHRAQAARAAGLEVVPALVATTITEAQAMVASMALNRLRGELDLGLVGDMLAELHAAGWTTEQLAVTGFTPEEVADMLDAAEPPSTEDLLAGGDTSLPADEGAAGAGEERHFPMELHFRTREELVEVRRRLKRAAGKGGDLADGLLKLLAVGE